MIRFGQAEAADGFAARQRRQVLLLLRFGAELIYRQHHQRGLHAHHGAETGIDALDFARNQPVAHIVEAAAAVALGDGGTQKTDAAHFLEYAGIGVLAAKRLEHARRQLALSVIARRIPNHFFLIRQLRIEQ